MKIVMLLVAALIVLGSVSWFLMGPGSAPATGGRDASSGDESIDSDAGELPPPLPMEFDDPRDLSPGDQERLLADLGPGAVLPIPPQDPGERGMGDMTDFESLSEEEIVEVEKFRRLAEESNVGSVTYISQPLSRVLSELAEASGITIELDGEDLANEPVTLASDENADRTLMEILTEIAHSRNLAFEVRTDRIVVRR